MLTKVCPGCPENGLQALEAFYVCARSKDGRQTRCKLCQKAYQAATKSSAGERARKQRGSVRPKRRANGGYGTLFPYLED